MRKNDIEKSLKRFLKRKVSYSLSLLIAFMITGGISLGAGITAEEIQETKSDLLTRIQTEREEIKRKIAENERLIKEYNSDFVELVRKGDFYSKPLFNSTQVFLSYQYLDSGKMKDRTNKEFSETIDAINKHYGTKTGRSLLRSTGNIGKDKIMSGNGVAVDNESFSETINLGANIKPLNPELPVIEPNINVSASTPTVNLGTLPGTVVPGVVTIPTVMTPTLVLPGTPATVSVNVSTPSAISAISVTAPAVTTPTTPNDKIITVAPPIAPAGFTPAIITTPSKPGAPQVVVPQDFTPPVISFNGTGFGQGAAIDMPKSNIIMQNYDSYTTSAPVIITTGNTGTTWTGGTVTAVTSPNGSTYPTTAGTYYLTPGSTGTRLNAFINELRDHNANIGGEYVMKDTGGLNNTKIFLSHNPAGVGGIGGSYQGINSPGERRAVFSGKLELQGIAATNNTNVLVGVEHQLWNSNCHIGAYSVFENRGEILLSNGNNIIGIMIDTETSPQANSARHKTINTGKIIINSQNSIGIDFGNYVNNYLLVDVSVGNIEVNGEKNYGLRMNDIHGNTYFDNGVTITSGLDSSNAATKITVGGKNNVGVSITKFLSSTANVNPIANISNLNIEVTGENVVGFLRNANYSTNNVNDMLLNSATIGTFSFGAGAKNSVLVRSDKYGIQINKDISSTLGSTGNVFAQATKTGKIINNAVLNSALGGFTGLLSSGTTGASVENKGTVQITGTGNNNVGMAVLDTSTGSNSGTIKVLGTGNNKSGIYNTGTFTISNGSNIEVSGEASSGIYNENTVNISGTVALKGADGTTGIYSDGGTITSTSGNNLSIIIDDTSNPATKGLAVYAEGGANVTLGAAKIEVKNGAAGVAAFGAATSISLIGSELKYSGEGYAAYSDGNGTINLSNANLELSGKATGVELDLLAPKIILNNTKITMMSNDATVANLKNATGLLSNSLKATVETNLGAGVTIVDGTSGLTTFDKYKIATVDGGDLTIDANMDKYSQNDTTDGYFYSRRFLGQRLDLTVDTGVTVTSSTDTAYATSYFNNQVVGLEMNSSKAATSAADAQINLKTGSKVIADRTDAGAGAIGLYMNFGKVDIAAGAVVEVEKEANVVNESGVGVYAVNGSTVTNAGEISVAGKNAIGILGMTYREQPMGTPLVDEFGSGGIFANQGKIEITNNQDIKLDGTGTIGIYAYNNSGGANTNSKVTNAGTIEVGESTSTNAAIGIYGDKSFIANNGNIKTGKEGIGIYGIKGSTISSLGTLTLGADGIGVMADGTSSITATSVTLAAGAGTDVNGKTGIFYKGIGSELQSINVAVDASAFDKGTAIFVEKMNLSSGGQIDVGKDGVGIFLKGNTSANTATNTGTINLTGTKTGAVGMYTKLGKIINTGTINVNNSTHIGMYAEGTGNTVANGNIINLNVNNSTGIFVKDGAKTELNIGNNINFISGVTNSLGVFADEATVEFKDNMSFINSNENKNIYVYGKDAAVEIDAGKTVTIDGMGTPATAGNKTVGIYLENAGTGSTFTSNTTGQLIVQKEAVGIYSKGNNTLNVNVTADGEKTTGVFIEDGSTITGTVTARGASGVGAVGVYGSRGAVTIGAVGLTLNTDTDKGTGMYLADGAYATGGKITVSNTAAVDNIGVYYSKGTASGTVTNGSEIELAGNKSIGIYAADGINLVNTKNITSTGLNNNIASYVGGSSTLTSNGNIIMTGTDNIGVYTGKGSGINNGTINLTGAAGTSSAGMVAKADAASDTASVENKNIITVGNNLGMYVAGAGTSSGKNTGTITATTGTGVYVDGGGNSFDGTGGSITSNAVGIYLKDTDANKITAGTLNISSGGVGVFGENAKIDFAVNVAGTGAVGVAAKNGSVISGNITTGQDSVGAYVLDNTVSFNGSVITTGTNSLNTSIGVLLANGIGTYTMNNVTVNAKNGVGIYLGTGANLTHNGTVTTENGIGIYVANGTTLTTGTTVLNVKNGGTGVYIDQGTANLGTTGSLTFNFSSGGGIGIYNNGGTMNIGSNISVTGSGSLAATKDGSLTSSGTLNIGTGAVGLLGEYGAATTTPKVITNTASGIINATGGGIGLAAIKSGAGPGAVVTITNAGTISASGKSIGDDPSIGIYTDTANVVNTGTINVGTNGIGIYAVFNGVGITVQNDDIKMNGSDGIGVYLKDGAGLVSGNSITGTGSNNTGLVLENTAVPASVGTISLGGNSIGVMATGTATTGTINGNISVGAGNNSIGLVSANGANVTLGAGSTVTTGANGIGVYVNTASTAVINDVSKISVGTEGVYLYSNGGNLSFAGNLTVNNQIGIAANGGTVTTLGATSITVTNGGIGAYIKGSVPTLTGTTINLQSGTASKYSMGIYYDGVAGIGTAPVINQTGNYTIGMVLNGSSGIASGVSITGQNQVGIMAQNGSGITAGGIVSVLGDKNIGIYGENSNIIANSGISVGNSTYTTDKSSSSIGIFMKGGIYTGSGNITAGDNSIGIYGDQMAGGSITHLGIGNVMNLGDKAIGFYGTGTSGNMEASFTGGTGTTGGNGTIAFYGKGIDMKVTSDISLGNDTSVGIVSHGTGDVIYNGAISVGDKSIGIYKVDGAGIMTTSADSWNIGKGGYGIYVNQSGALEAVVNNNASMVLDTSAVGIFSNGKNKIYNSGNITVGATDLGVSGDHSKTDEHLNSVGMYLAGGSIAENTGIITVNHDHSVGVYVTGTGSYFTNKGTGVLNLDGGGVGILVKDGGIALNEGTITLGTNLAICGAETVGMAAFNGGTILNTGTINVNAGIGMLVEHGGTLNNTGVLNVTGGVGIQGAGTVINKGTINVSGSGTESNLGGASGTANIGAVKIESDGTITINDQYVAIGGTLNAAGAIVVNGAYVDATTGVPMFNASNVTGEVRLLSNFASTGNGISYLFQNFVNTAAGTISGSKLSTKTSPLFVAKITTDGHLAVAKRPYADLTIGEQFDAMDKGLDNILKNSGGSGRDAEILKGLNEYLDGLPSDQFERETSQKLSEFRGDIYATIQGRMQDINQAFDNSFYELESSYNLTKDSSKYSVIYTDGKYRDSTLGIDEYDYKVMGLLYMKEKEGAEYGSKYGYTIGFAGSKFDFDDGGSKEDVYSLRVGAHRVKNLSEEHKVSWLSRIELGYNRHIAKRKLNLHETFENKGEYNTYSVALDNRLTKVIYTDLSRQLDVYADLDLEYGKIDDFKESAGSKGGLEVQIKDNDYLSAQAGAGVKASQRIYAGNDISVKVTADVKYAYEFGDNYDGNKARLKNGEEGYYSLITPEEREGKLSGKIGLTIEKANHMGVTFEVEAADENHKKDSSIKYGVRFNYKF
ncbi:autotransporter-associated N-terminal domain-containing protein [Fusobacterium ulcerans]|uniref:autotransporter-associated N-terminal domain-containing protein n=1 Tax=Fusobacterium ulcerans TaxID=861 RepID=UPI0010308E26|nr:autotransporter-associated N-terminal domain-containing protein [Fusobacterium ulcerans]